MGADPGSHSCVAAVRIDTGAARPLTLELVRHVGSAKPRAWSLKCSDAIEAVYESCGSAPERLWVESPPKRTRRGSFGGDKQGLETRLGLGRYQGMIIAHASLLPCEMDITIVRQPDWVAIYGRKIHNRKMRDGQHRIAEASMYVAGAVDGISKIPKSMRVDAAEAILIAGAAALDLLRRADVQRRATSR